MNKPKIKITNQAPSASYTKRVIYTEKIAKSMLWLAAGITISILVIIIGYILFRGFISSRYVEYDVINSGREDIYTGETSEDITIIAHKDIRIDDLVMDDLVELFNGRRKSWARVSEQDINVLVFAHNKDNNIRSEFDKIIGLDQDDDYAKSTVFLDTDEEIISRVSQNPGSIGYISSRNKSLIDNNIKILPFRRIAIVCSADVLEIVDNSRISFLTQDQVKKIFTGKINNWSEVKGPDLPIKVVIYSEQQKISDEFNDLILDDSSKFLKDATMVDSYKELIKIIETNKGVIGYSYIDMASKDNLPIIKVERHEVKQNLNLNFLLEEPRQAGVAGGVSNIIVNTLYMILLTLLFSTPIGIAAAIFLTEYAKQGKLIKLLRFGIETLAGIPSIIFGLFGFILFVNYLNIGIGLLSGTLTLTLMVLPTIIRTAEEAIKTVPLSYREGSLAMGATKWQTITRVIIPAAIPGILTGIILAMGRSIGETAALLFTMGTDYRMASSLSSSSRVLSVHLYILVKEGISFERAFATASILIIVILIINFITNRLIGRMSKVKG